MYTNHLSKAREVASKAGSVREGVEMYPTRRVWGASTPRSPGVFAYRFFNSDNREVGYYIPDTHAYFEFDTPRVWAQQFIDDLVF